MTRSSAFLPWQRLAPPLPPSSAVYFALITEVHQSGEVVVHDEDDVAAPAAVAAVRAASGHELLTMEAHCAVAALCRHGARWWRCR